MLFNPDDLRNLAHFILLAIGAPVFAQPELIWARQMGAKDNITSAPSDKGTGIVTDPEGNVYITGNFWGKADFDPGPGSYFLQSAGVSDIFVCKLNQAGQLVWAKRMGGSNYHNSNAIAIDRRGNLYITGSMQGSTTFSGSAGHTFQPSGYKDAFVCKLDSSGTVIWVRILGGIEGSMDQNEGISIAVDDSGYVYSTGTMYYGAGGIDLDPGPELYYLSSAGDLDVYVSKLDSAGSFVWGKKIGGSNREMAQSLCVDKAGNAYLSGSFRGKVDFDPDMGTYFLESQTGNQQAFLCKLNRNGGLTWAYQIGGSGTDSGNALCLDEEGNVLLAGVFGGTVDFDPDTGSWTLTGTNASTFICKYSAEGGFKWARHFSGRNTPYGICADRKSQIYLTGEISTGNNTPSDFDPGPDQFLINLAYNSPDIYIAKLDSMGWLMSAGTLGGQSAVATNRGFAVASDAAENLYVTGQYVGNTPDFNPDPAPGAVYFLPTTNMDDEDIFVGKYGTRSRPVAGFRADRERICPEGCIQFTDESAGAETWEWHFEGGSPETSSFREPGLVCYGDSGLYSVRLIAGRNGITDTLVKDIYIRVQPLNPSFSLEPGNFRYVFHAVQDSSQGITYHWDFGDGNTSPGRSTEHTYESTGSFDVCLEVKLDSVCSATSCINVETGITVLDKLPLRENWRYDHLTDRLLCENCGESPVSIQIYDLTGRLVYSSFSNVGTNGNISLSGCPLNNPFIIISIRGKNSATLIPAFRRF